MTGPLERSGGVTGTGSAHTQNPCRALRHQESRPASHPYFEPVDGTCLRHHLWTAQAAAAADHVDRPVCSRVSGVLLIVATTAMLVGRLGRSLWALSRCAVGGGGLSYNVRCSADRTGGGLTVHGRALRHFRSSLGLTPIEAAVATARRPG